MTFDVDLHRTTITLRDRLADGKPFEMSVIDAGPEQGDKFEAPTIVFIHGFGGRAAYWEYQLEQFHESYRVLALDLRGHGYTDAPTEADGARYDVRELVGDIEAALEALRVPQRFILVCHSFGGALATCFVNRHPQRVTALVIIASAVRFQLRLAGRLLLRVPPALLTWVREVLPYFGFNAAKVYPPAHVVYLQNRNGLAVWDGAELLRAIKIPSMVILGQRDTLFSDASYKEVARLIPAAEEVVIPVSAHQVMVERPDAVNRAILRFLQAQSDPLQVAQEKAAQKAERRAARKALEAERPWLKFYDSRTPYRIKPPTVPLSRLLPELNIIGAKERNRYTPYDGSFRVTRKTFTLAGQDSFTNPPGQDPDKFTLLTNLEPTLQSNLQRRRGYNQFCTLSGDLAGYNHIYSPIGMRHSKRAGLFGQNVIGVLTTDESGTNVDSPLFAPSTGASSDVRMVRCRDYGFFYDGVCADYKKWNAVALTNWGI